MDKKQPKPISPSFTPTTGTQYPQQSGFAHDLEQTNVLLAQEMFPAKVVKQRAIEALVIFTGNSAQLPSGTTSVQAYYEENTKRLRIWNTTTLVWDTVQFT